MNNNILNQIKLYKLEEIKKEKSIISQNDFQMLIKNQQNVKGFLKHLILAEKKGFGLIAEVKKASPSKGIIRKDFNLKEIILSYEKGGATCLSILTDEKSFKGKNEYLSQTRSMTNLPLLRKDFIFDIYQVFQSRALGADCILIILSSVDDYLAHDIEEVANELEMDVLIEVHNKLELSRALKMKSKLIGINNRDLKNFKTDLNVTEEIVKMIPKGYTVVSESGFKNHADLLRMKKVNVNSFLVGETLMRQKNITEATKNILGNK